MAPVLTNKELISAGIKEFNVLLNQQVSLCTLFQRTEMERVCAGRIEKVHLKLEGQWWHWSKCLETGNANPGKEGVSVCKTILALHIADHILPCQSLPSVPTPPPRSLMTPLSLKKTWWLWWMTGWNCTPTITRSRCLESSRNRTELFKNSSKSWVLWAASFWPNIGPFWSPERAHRLPHSLKAHGISSKNPEVLALWVMSSDCSFMVLLDLDILIKTNTNLLTPGSFFRRSWMWVHLITFSSLSTF